MRGRQTSSAGWRVVAPALLVAVCAVAATAHGLWEVAIAAGVPTWTAWTYPVITDGLALVAYAATHRLRGAAVGYAWAVTVLAAGLSGLAQATYLASEPLVAGPELRFGVGAWPAVAAAIVAHLLYLLATPTRPAPVALPAAVPVPAPVRPRIVADVVAAAQPTRPAVTVAVERAAESETPAPVAEVADLDKVRRLVADGAGRGLVARELGVKPHVARRLVEQVKQA